MTYFDGEGRPVTDDVSVKQRARWAQIHEQRIVAYLDAAKAYAAVVVAGLPGFLDASFRRCAQLSRPVPTAARPELFGGLQGDALDAAAAALRPAAEAAAGELETAIAALTPADWLAVASFFRAPWPGPPLMAGGAEGREPLPPLRGLGERAALPLVDALSLQGLSRFARPPLHNLFHTEKWHERAAPAADAVVLAARDVSARAAFLNESYLQSRTLQRNGRKGRWWT